MAVTNLDPTDGFVVLINTFTVEPDRADALLDELTSATERGMKPLPGFVSANLHMSNDKRHVTNYAQWRTKSDLDAMMADPAAQAHMQRAAKIAESFDPIYYELRTTVTA